MMKYWGFLVAGLIFMIGFAAFSGASITVVVPIMDNIFKVSDKQVEITTYKEFSDEMQNSIRKYYSDLDDGWSFTDSDIHKPVLGIVNTIMNKTDSYLLLKMISFLTIILFLVKNMFYYGNRVMFLNLRGKTVKDVRNLMFENYTRQTIAFFNQNRVGDSLVRMVNDVEQVSNYYIIALFGILKDSILVFVYIYMAIMINWKLFLISITVLPLFTMCVNLLGKKIKKYARKVQSQFSNMFSAVEEVLNSMKIVKAFSREKKEIDKIKGINKKHFKFWRKSELYNAINFPLSEINTTTTGIIMILIGGKMVLDPTNDFTFGKFFLFASAVFSILHPIKVIARSYNNIQKASVSLDRVSWVLDLKPEIIEKANPVEVNDFKSSIELKNVSFAYEEKKVLNNINLKIDKGEKIALVGGSGSGKTTLVNLLPRLYDVSSGEILIDGISVKDVKISSLRKLFGMVTQESILFSDSVYNNIVYGAHQEVNLKDAEKSAEIAHAAEFIEDLQDGYETVLHSRGSNFSGGQKQRLCIARAIIGNPPILIFDEATSALDTESEKKVQLAIEEATQNRTVIMIAHRLSTVLSSDRIVVMDKGEIISIGKHKDLLKSCSRYKHLYDLQFSQDQTPETEQKLEEK